MTVVLIILLVLALSGSLWYAWSLTRQLSSTREEQQKHSADHEVLTRLLADREEQLRLSQHNGSEKERELQTLHTDFAKSQVLNEQYEIRLTQQQQEMVQLQDRSRMEFENLANRIFEQKSEKFILQNQSSLENLLGPLKERIKDFEKKVEDTYTAESRERTTLQAEVKHLYELSQTLSREAASLTGALKADTRVQGNWGEMVLERVLEMSGLRRDIHYLVQKSLQDDSGSYKRPDVVILLPGDRQVVIDSKVTLSAYERYCSAENDSERQSALKSHLESVKRHVDSLQEKDYPSLYRQSPDFVLMFIPVEPAYSLALQQDNSLYDYAFRRHIIVVSIFTLLATLRLIESMWRLDSQNKHAAEIVRQGSALFDKFVGFIEDMKAIGRNIDQAQRSYGAALNKLSEGSGNLIRSAERMRSLGLENKKQLPTSLIPDENEQS